MGRDDRLNDLVLRSGGQVEESLTVYWGPVFAENQGRGGAGNSQLVGVYWIVVGTFLGLEVQRA